MKKLDLSLWEGTVEINGTLYSHIPSNLVFTDNMVIVLHTPNETTQESQEAKSDIEEYKITVKSYMTKPATPEFDFMAKFNNNEPMPMRTMVGYYDKETKGMYHMILHCDILQEQTQTCMCCGKPITNPVSKYFGVGPICGNHNYINPFNTEDELKQAVAEYRKKLNNITWCGWVIRSAITEMVKLN